MGSNLHYALTQLRKGAMLSLRDAQRSSVVVFRGSVWITQDGDPRDAFINAGETFTIDRRGLVLVEALEDTSLLVLGAESVPAHEAAVAS